MTLRSSSGPRRLPKPAVTLSSYASKATTQIPSSTGLFPDSSSRAVIRLVQDMVSPCATVCFYLDIVTPDQPVNPLPTPSSQVVNRYTVGLSLMSSTPACALYGAALSPWRTLAQTTTEASSSSHSIVPTSCRTSTLFLAGYKFPSLFLRVFSSPLFNVVLIAHSYQTAILYARNLNTLFPHIVTLYRRSAATPSTMYSRWVNSRPMQKNGHCIHRACSTPRCCPILLTTSSRDTRARSGWRPRRLRRRRPRKRSLKKRKRSKIMLLVLFLFASPWYLGCDCAGRLFAYLAHIVITETWPCSHSVMRLPTLKRLHSKVLRSNPVTMCSRMTRD